VGDLNGDGIPDIVTSNYSGTSISVFLGNGDGTYQTHVDYPAFPVSFGMALGDLNGDGIPDLVVAYHGARTA
jgi:VCBS repeat protein